MVKGKCGQFGIPGVIMIFLIVFIILWACSPMLNNVIGSSIASSNASNSAKFMLLIIPVAVILFFGISFLLNMRSG